ncbi:N-acetylneuraminate synthase [Terribacillus sp. DMT04]|uniref:N-acetylneuraminate synthase n=1 Tax=Terribacillus sp. DMT04 TaxID=2850441 RepID=UPI001C2C0B6F|nr:N-acetylneuraminate synthase [Terribacillus sp. DMT04]QXE00954.1 N-acetylneuraminate synthase [Terribacillus sp. DMT04]
MIKTFIIAEAGVNHNGSLDLAYKLIDAAVDAGADAIKFQTFKTEKLVTRTAKQADYQVKNIGAASSQFDMLKRLELSYENFRQLKNYCEEKRILFLSTPFDFDSVDFLIKDLEVKLIKIPSGEITNAPYLHRIAKYNVKTIVSTGMASMEEIHQALAFLAYGYAQKEQVNFSNVTHFYNTAEAKLLLSDNVHILHCTSEYPTPPEDINLNAMDSIKKEFHVNVGLSDHSKGIEIPVAAAAKGAQIIEKHFTLNKTLPGPDHKASLEPNELKEMIQSIRLIEKALGKGEKKPTQVEVKNKDIVRKSLVASKQIKKGEIFTTENLTVKRPGTGVSPYYYWDYIGNVSNDNYEEDEVIHQ